MKNTKKNRGFSLVELIVVVAIMAILVGVLAPSLLGNVEKSRVSKDELNCEELRHSVEVALADEDVFAKAADGNTITVTASGTTYTCDAAVKTAVQAICSDATLTSKTHANDTYTITINIDGTDVSVSGSF